MNSVSNNVDRWSATVDQFLKSHARGLLPEDREDLRQDIFVALIETYGPTLEARTDELLADLVSLAVLDTFRAERRARTAPQILLDEEHLSISAPLPQLDLGLDIRKALDRLPNGLRNVAVDLFFLDLSQKEVADKYNRNQTWVAAAKRQIVQQVYSFLKEKSCR